MAKKDKISKLASEAAESEKESPGFMEPGSKVKRGRGRPKREDGPSPSADLGSASSAPRPAVPDPVEELMPLTTQVTKFYSGMLVQIAEDDRAALDDQTQNIMARSTATCMQQYFPNAIGTHASLVVLLCIVGQTGFNAYRLRQENLAKLIALKKQMDEAKAATPERPIMGMDV